MEKKVQRKEVDLFIRPGSGSKLAAGGRSLIGGAVSTSANSNYNIPDVDSLAQKYGLQNEFPNQSVIEQLESKIAVVEQEKESKIREMESVISNLRYKVDEKNNKIEQLCVLLESLEPIPGVNPAVLQNVMILNEAQEPVDLRDSKIVALAKKVHKLNMQINKEKASNDRIQSEFEDYKNRYDQLQQEFETFKTIAQNNKSEKVYNRHALANNIKKEEEEQVLQTLQKQLKETSKSNDEMKKKMKELTDENKTLTRTLQKEIGDGIALEQAVDEGWRGRAQQIVMLKSKVKQLESTIAQGVGAGGTISGRSVYSSTKFTRGGGEDVDSKAEEGLQEMSRERRQVVEQLTEERIQLHEQNVSLEKKSSAQKARISILENEIRRLKDNLQVAVDKSQNDDELLDVLKKEIGKLQSKLSRTQDDLVNATSLQSSLRKQLTLTLKGERLPAGCESPSKTRDDSGLNESEMKEQELKRLQRLCKHQSEQLDSQDQTIQQLRRQMQHQK